jgi:hypothetical protein
MKSNYSNLLRNSSTSFCLFLILLLSSCVEEYTNNPTLSSEILIVDGLITNQLDADTIAVSYSKGRAFDVEIVPVKNCKITILSDEGQVYNLQEDADGKYYTPSNMVRQIGKSYKLKLSIPNGDNYESNFEKMTEVPVPKVYDVFDEKAILNPKGNIFRKGNKVYINFQDPPEVSNKYLFRYKYYEQIAICKTCYNSRVLQGTDCEYIELKKYYPFFDYVCKGDCWDIYYDNSINIFSDEYSNGKLINGLLIGSIPYVNYTGALMEIKQYSISTEGYRFYNLLYLQGQKTGSLTDTPPSPIVGNIRNIDNPQRIVTGFFGASAVSSIKYTVDRKKNIGSAEEYLGHSPVTENAPELGRVAPEALCIESKTRTKIKPIGWTK